MSKIEAKIIMAKCPHKGGKLYGIRIQKAGNDWIRTWTFKVSAEQAKHEGYDKECISGSFKRTPEYPGCPYCGGMGFARCSCGKIFCSSESNTETCPWCGETAEYSVAETFDMQGGDF